MLWRCTFPEKYSQKNELQGSQAYKRCNTEVVEEESYLHMMVGQHDSVWVYLCVLVTEIQKYCIAAALACMQS